MCTNYHGQHTGIVAGGSFPHYDTAPSNSGLHVARARMFPKRSRCALGTCQPFENAHLAWGCFGRSQRHLRYQFGLARKSVIYRFRNDGQRCRHPTGRARFKGKEAGIQHQDRECADEVYSARRAADFE